MRERLCAMCTNTLFGFYKVTCVCVRVSVCVCVVMCGVFRRAWR